MTRSLVLGVLTIVSAVWVGPSAIAHAGHSSSPPLSHITSHSVDVTDTAHLHLVSSPGALLLEEGTATGSLPGPVKVRLRVGVKVRAAFRITTTAGSITGQGSGRLHGTGTYASFGGVMHVTQGTGRYANARGAGGLYGTINRRTDAMTVQTTGRISY